ncbi:MAG: hypothetical protein HQK65_02810 [Desulfamplus sp.]|nr:hypothetical protein [Desulfamplus sp.]
MSSYLIGSIPMSYYLTTRYNNWNKRIIYVIKYFGIHILVAYLLGFAIDFFLLIIALSAFYSLYDFFCFANDLIDIPEHRKVKWKLNRNNYAIIKASIAIFFTLVIAIVSSQSAILVFIILMSTIVVFILHNNIFFLKPITFISLYMLKSILFFVAISGADYDSQIHFFIFTLLFNMSYLPGYIMRKFMNIKVNELMRPIWWKNIGFLIYIFFSPIVSLSAFVFTNLVTAIEWGLSKVVIMVDHHGDHP